MGRPVEELLQLYIQYKRIPLGDYLRLSDKVSASKINKLSLEEYCVARNRYCSLYHSSPCTECDSMVKAARCVLTSGVCSLQSVFTKVFPSVTYHTLNAKRRLLQMPLVAIQVWNRNTKKPEVQLIELVQGVNYLKVFHLLNGLCTKSPQPSLSKSELNQLLLLAQSDRERELIKCTAFRASGLSTTAARKQFGFQNIPERLSRLEESIKEVVSLRECIDDLSRAQEKAFMTSLGYSVSDSSESSGDEDSVMSELSSVPLSVRQEDCIDLNAEEFLKILSECMFNWFQVIERISDENPDKDEHLIANLIDDFFPVAMKSDFDDSDKSLIEQSYQAFKCDLPRRKLVDREAQALDGFIVTDSESEDPDQYLELDITSERAKALITKKRKQVRRRARYQKSKLIAQRNYLSRKPSTKTSGILKDFPNIGDEIEKYVQSCNVGADAWRRTGILTFDGNTKVKHKATYERIRQHLVDVYKRHFSFGTVVQLCVARNKRRQSAKRYKGVAKVTSRRARKGFMLKYNPDAHWSAAFYRNLNLVQYTDGRHILNVNRDDAAGFRLDTMATHRLHRTPIVQGSETTTTYTDYVNRYKAVLQTTSYNFSKTKTTLEYCAGVVKATGLFPKNPTQHLQDLEMLENTVKLRSAFINPLTNEKKFIECIRVDGASDEGPSHEEVQFVWTARHISKPTLATLVTARNSGSSYLNRVELQNGCLAVAHANLFIPSTLSGSCMDSTQVNREKYETNMNLATDVYLNRVNGCPCGETVIHLYKGEDSSQRQVTRKYVLQYLKGSKAQKQELKSNMPELYSYFEAVWEIRNKHMLKDLPPQYAFHLVCCFDSTCTHPLCSKGNISIPSWFDSGPLITQLPLPIPDPTRCYGNDKCDECKSFCCGHFMRPESTLTSTLPPMRKPPSVVLKEAFDSLQSFPPSDTTYIEMSKKVMLSVEEVKMWFDHLNTIHENRRKGAVKAAATRKQKKKKTPPSEATRESNYQCGLCYMPYQEFTDACELWIGCEICDTWFHFTCLGITTAPDVFLCPKCNHES